MPLLTRNEKMTAYGLVVQYTYNGIIVHVCAKGVHVEMENYITDKATVDKMINLAFKEHDSLKRHGKPLTEDQICL